MRRMTLMTAIQCMTKHASDGLREIQHGDLVDVSVNCNSGTDVLADIPLAEYSIRQSKHEETGGQWQDSYGLETGDGWEFRDVERKMLDIDVMTDTERRADRLLRRHGLIDGNNRYVAKWHRQSGN